MPKIFNMKKLFRISLGFNLLTICSFCLPFFLNNCEGKKEESKEISVLGKETIESEKKLEIEKPLVDTTKVQKTILSSKKDEYFATEIVGNYPILKPIIEPKHNTFTGLGTILNTIPYYFQFSISFGMLMLILGFFSKIVEQKITYTHLIIDILAIIFIKNAIPIFFDFEYLWGYWFCLTLIILMLMWDSWVLYKMKKSLTIAR